MAKVLEWIKAHYDRVAVVAAAAFLFISAVSIWWSAIQFGTRLLTPEPPRVQSCHLDPGGDHAGGHRIVVQDSAHTCAVPVVEEPRSGETKHPSTMPDDCAPAHDGITRPTLVDVPS